MTFYEFSSQRHMFTENRIVNVKVKDVVHVDDFARNRVTCTRRTGKGSSRKNEDDRGGAKVERSIQPLRLLFVVLKWQ